jgi:hypothetical protein
VCVLCCCQSLTQLIYSCDLSSDHFVSILGHNASRGSSEPYLSQWYDIHPTGDQDEVVISPFLTSSCVWICEIQGNCLSDIVVGSNATIFGHETVHKPQQGYCSH